LDIFGLAI